jgi:hypothetical protein
MRGTPETLLVGASRDQIRLGYYIGLMKIYATRVTKIMEAHPLQPEELLGFRKMPAAAPEPSIEAEPTSEPIQAEGTPAIAEPVDVEAGASAATPEPTIAAVEEPGLETVDVASVSAEVNDVSVDDKEAILAALKALGFDEPE